MAYQRAGARAPKAMPKAAAKGAGGYHNVPTCAGERAASTACEPYEAPPLALSGGSAAASSGGIPASSGTQLDTKAPPPPPYPTARTVSAHELFQVKKENERKQLLDDILRMDVGPIAEDPVLGADVVQPKMDVDVAEYDMPMTCRKRPLPDHTHAGKRENWRYRWHSTSSSRKRTFRRRHRTCAVMCNVFIVRRNMAVNST